MSCAERFVVAGPLSDRGVIVARGFDRWPPQEYRRGDFNPERIAVQEDDRLFDNDFRANVGDTLGDVTGDLAQRGAHTAGVVPETGQPSATAERSRRTTTSFEVAT